MILDAQTALLDASIASKVPRFIPSDYSLGSHYIRTTRISNTLLAALLDQSGIAWTLVLNGGFTEILLSAMPLVNHYLRA